MGAIIYSRFAMATPRPDTAASAASDSDSDDATVFSAPTPPLPRAPPESAPRKSRPPPPAETPVYYVGLAQPNGSVRLRRLDASNAYAARLDGGHHHACRWIFLLRRAHLLAAHAPAPSAATACTDCGCRFTAAAASYQPPRGLPLVWHNLGRVGYGLTDHGAAVAGAPGSAPPLQILVFFHGYERAP